MDPLTLRARLWSGSPSRRAAGLSRNSVSTRLTNLFPSTAHHRATPSAYRTSFLCRRETSSIDSSSDRLLELYERNKMKSFAFVTSTLLFALLLLLATVAAIAVESSNSNSNSHSHTTHQHHHRKLEDWTSDYSDVYEPWDLGTDVYYEVSDVGYWGDIANYSNGRYTIKWKDSGEVEFFDDTDEVDGMVEDAAFVYYNGVDADENAPWAQGTDVYVEEDGLTYWGQITAYRRGTYTTTWEDGEVEYYDDGEDLDDMVYSAYEKLTNNEADDDFDPNAASHNFKEQEYKIGTVVAHQVGNSMVMGTITGFDKTTGIYTVEWDNGLTDRVEDIDLLHEFVLNAADIIGRGGRGTDDNDNKQSSSSSSSSSSASDGSGSPPTNVGSPINTSSSSSSKDSRSGGAKFGIVVVVLGICIVGAVWMRRKFRTGKETTTTTTTASTTSPSPASDLDLARSAPAPVIT